MTDTPAIKAVYKCYPPHVIKSRKIFKIAESKSRVKSNENYQYRSRLIEELDELKVLLGKTQQEKFDGHNVSAEIADLEVEIAEKHAEIAAHDEEVAKNPGVSGMVDRMDGWAIANTRGKTWRFYAPETKRAKGQSAKLGYANACQETDAQKKAIKHIEIACVSDDEVRARITLDVDEVCSGAKPDVRDTLRRVQDVAGRRRQGHIKWSQEYVSGNFHNDGFALCVWMNRDSIIERLCAEAAAIPRSGLTLTLAERDQRLIEAKARLLELERLEEVWFLLASKEDGNLQRRPIDMRALLQVEEVPKTTGTVSGSSFDVGEFG